jgi:hypothetical protein
MRVNYHGLPIDHNSSFDAELLGNVILALGNGKAAVLDGLTAEHLHNSHPIISTLLAKIYNLMMYCVVTFQLVLVLATPCLFLKLKIAARKRSHMTILGA